MGLSDRDYMGERRSTEQMWGRSQPVKTRQSILWMVLTWVSILFLLYKSFLWWESREKPVKALEPSIQLAAPEANPVDGKLIYRPPIPQPSQQHSMDRAAPAHSGSRSVTKCLVNGQVTFTDKPCPNGSTVSTVTVNTANVGTVVPQTPKTASPQVQHQSVVTNFPPTVPVDTSTLNNAECANLEEQIKRIDDQARRPQSAQTQDYLSALRKKVRSRQYQLRC
jgi:hypothetical protein